MQWHNKYVVFAVSGVLIVALAGLYIWHAGDNVAPAAAHAGASTNFDTVTFNDKQLGSIEVNPVSKVVFTTQRNAIGTIDFNQNQAVQVFAPYQGKVIKAFSDVGDHVVKGGSLFTIDSPDLVQAESTLIAASGVYELTTVALTRAKALHDSQGLAQKDMEQAVSDQQTAEAALHAARDAVRVFGKSESDIDKIIATRKIDPVLVVHSPITGVITARAAQPGLLLQPGNAPAPFTVANLSSMWMVANVSEADSPAFHVGQSVRVNVTALPGQTFSARIAVVGASVDPTTRTVTVRSDIKNPEGALRAGMFATYVIETGAPTESLAVPLDGVARESDGSFSVWVASDRHTFKRHTVKLGLQQNGFDQILSGLNSGDKVVTKGAIFLSNMGNANSDAS